MLETLLIILITSIFLFVGLSVICVVFLFDLMKIVNKINFGFGSAQELAEFIEKNKKGE